MTNLGLKPNIQAVHDFIGSDRHPALTVNNELIIFESKKAMKKAKKKAKKAGKVIGAYGVIHYNNVHWYNVSCPSRK